MDRQAYVPVHEVIFAGPLIEYFLFCLYNLHIDLIRFIQYSKQYNNQPVISAHLDLPHGIYWLSGENGSGKTTLVKSIAGLIPFSGQIEVAGTGINTNRIGYRHLVNYAEAEPQYPGFLTGNDLVSFYTETKHADQQQGLALANALNAGSYLSNKIGTYSSGMAKKLSTIKRVLTITIIIKHI